MKTNNPNTGVEIEYGLAPNGRLIHVTEAEHGLACNCVCPNCHARLEARKGPERTAHFAHYGKRTHDAKVCYMTVVHRLAEQIILEKKCIMLPPMNCIPEKLVHFVSVEVETRNDRSDLQPDVVGVLSDGTRILIEIKKTSAVNSEKRKKIYADDLICMEIDISRQTPKRLEDFLLNSSRSRIWINNSIYVKRIMENHRESAPSIAKKVDYCKNKCTYRFGCKAFGWKKDTISYKGEEMNVCQNPSMCSNSDSKAGTNKSKDTKCSTTSSSIRNGADSIWDNFIKSLKSHKEFDKSGEFPTKIVNFWRNTETKCAVVHTSTNSNYNYIFIVTGVYLSEGELKRKEIGKYDTENKAICAAKRWLGNI